MWVFDFLREVRQELGRVIWPSGDEVIEATVGVIFFSGVIAVYFWILDFALSNLLRMIMTGAR